MNRMLYGPVPPVPALADWTESLASLLPAALAPRPNAIAPMPAMRRKSRRELGASGRSSCDMSSPPPSFAAPERRRMANRLLPLHGSEFHGEVEAQGLALEPVLGREFVEIVEVHHGVPRHVGQPELPADGVDLVMHVGIPRVAAGVVGQLPLAVAGGADLEEQRMIGRQGQVLARSPVQCEAQAGRQVEAALLLIDFVGQRGGERGGVVLSGIPGDGPLKLVRPEAQPDVVGGLDLQRTDHWESRRVHAVFPDWRIETVGKREVPVGKRPVEPERLHIYVAGTKGGRLSIDTATGLDGKCGTQAGGGEGR